MPRPKWPVDGVPVVEIAIEPKSFQDLQRLSAAIDRLAEDDPDFRFKIDEESGQTIIGGVGEMHLDIVVDRLRNEFGILMNVGAPQVAYREAITRTVDHDYTHKKQSGGSGKFARIKFRIEPAKPGGGFTFVSAVAAGNIPAEYIPAIEKAVQSVMDAGPVMGFPIVDVKFTLLDGAYHDIDSSVLTFEIASRAGFKEAIEKAGPKILEPIMAVEVTAPEDCLGDVIGDLNSRRGQVRGVEGKDLSHRISALVPLTTMFGYVNSLRTLSRGRGQFSMRFDHYERVPDRIDPDDGPFGGAMAMRA